MTSVILFGPYILTRTQPFCLQRETLRDEDLRLHRLDILQIDLLISFFLSVLFFPLFLSSNTWKSRRFYKLLEAQRLRECYQHCCKEGTERTLLVHKREPTHSFASKR